MGRRMAMPIKKHSFRQNKITEFKLNSTVKTTKSTRQIKTQDNTNEVSLAQTPLKSDILDQNIIDGLPEKKAIAVINKSDLPQILNIDVIKSIRNFTSVISVSAIYNQGIENLKSEIHNSIIVTDFDISNDILISNMRHKALLEKTLKSLNLVKKSLNKSFSPELIAVDLQAALNSLGEITGETTSEDILNNIFLKFCVGK